MTASVRGHRDAAAILAARSPRTTALFGRLLFGRDLARSFHAVRLAGELPRLQGPTVVFANHPSWWDGELFVWLAATTFAHRATYAPIEAAMMKRYAFFAKVGAFAVAPGYAGAATFLAVGEELLKRADGLLLVNAEGRFRDVRERPLGFAPGLVHLARRTSNVTFVPLAIEYAFWDERRPNLLLRFGPPIPAAALAGDRGGTALREALTVAMDALAEDARSRDPARFTVLLGGRTGINPIYDAWRGLRARLRGRRFDPAHRADVEEYRP